MFFLARNGHPALCLRVPYEAYSCRANQCPARQSMTDAVEKGLVIFDEQ